MTDPVRNAPVPPHRSLLPPNATPQERALEGATERAASVPGPLRETWNPETCPVALLPWLAWAFSIDEWREDWSEDAKRASIRDAVMIHRRKGTVWAIKRVLANAGYGDARLIEGNSGIRYDGSFRHDGVHTYGDPKGWARYARSRAPRAKLSARCCWPPLRHAATCWTSISPTPASTTGSTATTASSTTELHKWPRCQKSRSLTRASTRSS